MDQTALIEETVEAIFSLNGDKVSQLVDKALEENMNLAKLINEGLTGGLRRLGERFESGEVFLPELMLGAEIVQQNMQKLESLIENEEVTKRVKMVIGTVTGDLHDVGKNIVIAVFAASGFEVIDLGIDVPTETFVDTVRKEKPHFLGLSALLTTTMHMQREVIEALVAAGLREGVTIIVGGAPTSESWAKKINADIYAEDAFLGLKKAEQTLQ